MSYVLCLMSIIKPITAVILFLVSLTAYSQGIEEIDRKGQGDHQLVRMAELEIHPEYWEEYKKILIYEARESILKEKGVVSIFPMEIKDDEYKIRILEIYANQKAYEDHLKTPHFQYYKTNTLKMVKDLKLIDMKALDKKTMGKIFLKDKIRIDSRQ